LLAGRLSLSEFDLIYSTGLFDYLNVQAARRLAFVLFQLLRPGGKLLIANFLPGIPAVGYMESYMDWHLIYRTRSEMLDVADEISQTCIRDIRLFAEENENIIFLEVTKK
jgi:predicted SAM-dependent methyltransferase